MLGTSSSFMVQIISLSMMGSPVPIVQGTPIHISTLASMSATTRRTSTPHALLECSCPPIIIVREMPAFSTSRRQLWVRDNSVEPIEAAVLRAKRAVLDATPNCRGFAVWRRLFKNLA